MLPAVLIFLLLTNLAAFVAFGLDTRRAKLGKRRISEAQLLWFVFFGGILGGWFATSTFRHKTRKTSFRVKMALVSVVNLAWPLLWLAFDQRDA